MRHLLAIADLSRAEIERLLDQADEIARSPAESSRSEAGPSGESGARREAKGPTEGGPMRGALVVNLFLEPSTRTRVSFETAAKRLGAEVVNIAAEASSVVKGETLLDTARTLDAMGPEVIVIRHPAAGAAAYLAGSGVPPGGARTRGPGSGVPPGGARTREQWSWRLRASIVNAGDGSHEHPTQALLDALTVRRVAGPIAKKVVAIVGDLRHSRVARSAIQVFSKLGATVRVAGPRSLVPPGIEALGCTVSGSLQKAMSGADVVMTLRIQKERMAEAFVPSMKEYAAAWRIDEDRMKWAGADAILMHPGPMNRGVEITSAAADSARSVVSEQVATGVHVRMAVLRALHEGHRAAQPRRARA